ncbi:MAG: TetR/AcrR family transcriptional regulator [Thermomicrobiales bacterium]
MAIDQLTARTPHSRRERLRALMREDILGAARTIVLEEGYTGLSMRALGRAVGVTAPTLYDYFASKEAVLDALHAEGVLLLTDAFQSAIARGEPGMARLLAIGEAYRRFALDHPDFFRLIFGHLDAAYKPGDKQIDHGSRIFDLVVDVVQEAMDRGELAPGDPRIAALTIWALGHGCVMLEMLGMSQKCAPAGEVDSIYEHAFRRLFAGMQIPEST